MNGKVKSAIYHAFMGIGAFIMAYPLLWMLASSFKDNRTIFLEPLSLLPTQMDLGNYVTGWAGFGGITFATFFRNSFIIAGFSTVGAVASAAVVAFGFARVKFRGRKVWFAIMIATLMLPFQVIMVPQYVLFLRLDWVNTFLPLIVPQFLGFPFFIFLVMQFIRGIPKELDESAYIDGANRYRIFAQVILPNIMPALVTVAIFSFYWRWNEFLGPLIYLSIPQLYPVSVALRAFADPDSLVNWAAVFSMGVLSVLPVLTIFLVFQRYIVEGISTSGLKG